MALQKVVRNMLSTGVSDSSDATAITIDSSENVTFAGTIAATSVDASAGFLNGSNGGIRIHTGGTKFFNITAANAARDNHMDIGASDARFKALYLGDKIYLGGLTLTSNDAGRIGLNRNPDDGTSVNSGSLQRYQINGPYSSGDYLDFQNYDSSGTYLGGFRIDGGAIRAEPLGVSTPSYSFDNDTNTGMTRPTSDTLQLVCGGSPIVRIDDTDTMFGKASNDINTAGFHIISAGTYAGSCYSGITSAVASSTYHVRDTTNNTWEFYVSNAGVISATSTSITSLSDERLKENIKDLETGLDEVMALKPRRFDWKDRKEKNVAGFIAQEVEPVLPDLIGDYMHDDLDDAKSVKMADMIPTLVKAIQELKIEIEELKK